MGSTPETSFGDTGLVVQENVSSEPTGDPHKPIVKTLEISGMETVITLTKESGLEHRSDTVTYGYIGTSTV